MLLFAGPHAAEAQAVAARRFALAAGQHVVVARSGNAVATWPSGTGGADIAALRRCL